MILIGVSTHKRAKRTLPVWIEKANDCVPRDLVGGLMLACDGADALEFGLQFAQTGWGVKGSETRVGVAANKSRIFASFLENPIYTHLFLFEDDCWPVRPGWIDFYLDHHRRGETEALLFLPDRMYGKVAWSRLLPAGGALLGYEKDGGMMMSLTRKAIEKCGGFHRAFKAARYGGEHSELMRRLKRNGLMPWTYLAPKGCEDYLDGWDYANWRGTLRSQPGYSEWCKDVQTLDVSQLPAGQTKQEAEQGLAIFERVKDDGSVFHHPRWE